MISLFSSTRYVIYFQERKITLNHSNKGHENKSYILEVCQKQGFDQGNRQHLSRPPPQVNILSYTRNFINSITAQNNLVVL